MVDLTNVLGGPWSPALVTQPEPPEVQLRLAIESAGMTAPNSVELDGKVHRFRTGTKGRPGNGDKTGWYIAFNDGVPAGRFGCWREGSEHSWRADIGRSLTHVEEMAHTRRMNEAKKARDAELERSREVASDTVELIWTNCTSADVEHPYLQRKGIRENGARVTGDGRLVVPLYNPDGALTSLQYISSDGGKLYHSGGQTGGCFWTVGTMDEPGTLYIAEGFATAATIFETTRRPCIVAYSASNLPNVAGTMRERYGAAQDLVIVADNDASGVGQKYADQASAKHGCRVIMPPVLGDANDYKQAGGDLAALLTPAVSDWLIPADDFAQSPKPIKWLVKHWLQDQALIMVHGPSGGGKTFVVLDWCLTIAAGLKEWNGHKVKPGAVVYLAGEGHNGLRGRVAAWKQERHKGPLRMWLSRAGCDLNTPEGYRRVVESVRALPEVPRLIVVDTLHRFLFGDENSAQDAKTMIDACAALMAEFDCTVLLVHHTGVSDEAQHRARGSSAWKGALEIEVSIIPAKGEAPMQIVQRKVKDGPEAAPISAELRSVAINGWLDEDGEAVSSAVLVVVDTPEVRVKESSLEKHKRVFENAWWDSGAEDRNGSPYVSRSAFISYLIKSGLAKSEASAKQAAKPSELNRPIGAMILAQILEPYEHGWRVQCDVLGSSLILARGT
jgi:putative DNA primase/helicase